MTFTPNVHAKVVLVDSDGVGIPSGNTTSPLNVSLRTPAGDSAMDETNDAVKVVSSTSATKQDDAAFTPGTSYVAVLGATADETTTDSVDEGDAGALRMTLDRRLLVAQCGSPLSERISDATGTSTVFSTFTTGSGLKNYITAISVKNAHATTDAFVDFRDGAAGAVLYTVAAPAAGGAVLSGGGGVLFSTTANTALAYDVSGAVTTVYISVSGYRGV